MKVFVPQSDGFHSRQLQCENAILADVIGPANLGHFPQNMIATDLANQFGGFCNDFHVARYRERDYVIFLPQWVHAGDLVRRSLLYLAHCKLRCFSWNPHRNASRSLITLKVWIRLVNLPFECWSESRVASIVNGFGRFLKADENSLNVFDLTSFRCQIAVEDPSDIPENLAITMGDLTVPVSVVLESSTAPFGGDDRGIPFAGGDPDEGGDQTDPLGRRMARRVTNRGAPLGDRDSRDGVGPGLDDTSVSSEVRDRRRQGPGSSATNDRRRPQPSSSGEVPAMSAGNERVALLDYPQGATSPRLEDRAARCPSPEARHFTCFSKLSNVSETSDLGTISNGGALVSSPSAIDPSATCAFPPRVSDLSLLPSIQRSRRSVDAPRLEPPLNGSVSKEADSAWDFPWAFINDGVGLACTNFGPFRFGPFVLGLYPEFSLIPFSLFVGVECRAYLLDVLPRLFPRGPFCPGRQGPLFDLDVRLALAPAACGESRSSDIKMDQGPLPPLWPLVYSCPSRLACGATGG